MTFFIIVKIAIRALLRNKMRTALTMLGIIIGIGSVIGMVSLGQGAQASVQAQINSMGANLLYITPGTITSSGTRVGSGSASTLNAEDIESIKLELASVKAASPGVRANASVVFGNQNWTTSVQGVNEDFPQIRIWNVSSGEFFTQADVRSATRVCVLGQSVVNNLFTGIDPIGQTIRLRNLAFRVVGVMAVKGQSSFGPDQDDVIFIPYTAAQKKLLSINHIHFAMVSALSEQTTYTAQSEITALLRERHKLTANEDDDFTVRNMTDVSEAADESNRILTILLGSIASVSLLVGGIGIMNIMLVSITERTREIGIRMAIGARSNQIRLQFLIEAIVLSSIGGLIGIAFGIGIAYGISAGFGWPTLISKTAIIVSVIFSIAVGVFFGFYPAHKAASLEPIEALRYE